MKFENRKQKRQVNENIVGLLVPMKNYLTKEMQEYVDITLRILMETEVEGETLLANKEIKDSAPIYQNERKTPSFSYGDIS